MKIKTPIVAANWKCNLDLAQVTAYRSWLKTEAGQYNTQLIFFSSNCFLPLLSDVRSDSLWLGAQNVSTMDKGAYTGEEAAFQLKSLSVDIVLVGHSERRHVFHESEETLGAKLHRLVEADLPVCFCFGETLQQRKSNLTLKTVDAQLMTFVDIYAKADPDSAFYTKSMLAYEPVWAIGTGVNAEPSDIESVHTHVVDQLAHQSVRLPILYGGSVNPANIYEIIQTPGVSGALVGGASNQPESFSKIIAEVNRSA